LVSFETFKSRGELFFKHSILQQVFSQCPSFVFGQSGYNNLHTTNNEDIIQHDSLKQCKIEEFHPITIRNSQTETLLIEGIS
jgi:hypothetical protein